MSFHRFIPALSTIGVVAGLAATRLVVEVVPFGRAAVVVSAWVHDVPARASEVVATPKRAIPVPTKVVSITAAQVSESVPAQGTTPGCEDAEQPATKPKLPAITNSISPETPAAGWIGA